MLEFKPPRRELSIHVYHNPLTHIILLLLDYCCITLSHPFEPLLIGYCSKLLSNIGSNIFFFYASSIPIFKLLRQALLIHVITIFTYIISFSTQFEPLFFGIFFNPAAKFRSTMCTVCSKDSSGECAPTLAAKTDLHFD